MSEQPKSKHPENTNKNYNSQNTEDYLSKDKRGSDLSNFETPAPGTARTAERGKSQMADPRNSERENIDPNIS